MNLNVITVEVGQHYTFKFPEIKLLVFKKEEMMHYRS